MTKETVPGITNFARVETTIACAGATTPAAMAEVKKTRLRVGHQSPSGERGRGRTSMRRRLPPRQPASSTSTCRSTAASPDPVVVEQFLKAVTTPANQPAFVHCASGNRAAALWMIKRMTVDGWDADRASTEAAALGLTSPALKTFATDYVAAHKSPK